MNLFRRQPIITLTADEIKPDMRSTIEKATASAQSLIASMQGKRDVLELRISEAQEELRQVNIVIDGAQAMLETVTRDAS